MWSALAATVSRDCVTRLQDVRQRVLKSPDLLISDVWHAQEQGHAVVLRCYSGNAGGDKGGCIWDYIGDYYMGY